MELCCRVAKASLGFVGAAASAGAGAPAREPGINCYLVHELETASKNATKQQSHAECSLFT